MNEGNREGKKAALGSRGFKLAGANLWTVIGPAELTAVLLPFEELQASLTSHSLDLLFLGGDVGLGRALGGEL
eukprot:scaffold161848_cov19-Tisochrysis_lutea.AAC.1